MLELGAMAILVKMAKSCSVEEVTKALYAISALVRNNLDGQELFYQEAGYSMLQVICMKSESSNDCTCLKVVAIIIFWGIHAGYSKQFNFRHKVTQEISISYS